MKSIWGPIYCPQILLKIKFCYIRALLMSWHPRQLYRIHCQCLFLVAWGYKLENLHNVACEGHHCTFWWFFSITFRPILTIVIFSSWTYQTGFETVLPIFFLYRSIINWVTFWDFLPGTLQFDLESIGTFYIA